MGGEKETVTIRIDGQSYPADPSRTVLQVALENGIQIPYFCYHPYLSIPGNCRQCQVKVEKMPKLVVSCSTRVADGMVVDTRCEEVKKAQAANMEFLLLNHPLDCPICDQVGECWLQEHAYTVGPGRTRFREEKLHFDKRVDIGRHVMLDKERCIQCTRCIRFCDEVTGTSELALVSRSNRTEVDIFPGRPLDNPYSGNVVDICPVGALTLKEFRFQSRLWFLETESSVCPGCARGCNITVWHRDGGIARITPRENPEVNRCWICDHGRLISGVLEEGERLREPRVAAGPAAGRPDDPWAAALEEAASILRDAGNRVAAVVGGWSTVEEAYLAIRILEHLGGGNGAPRVAVPPHPEGPEDDFLLRADRTPNRRGLLELLASRSTRPLEPDALADGRPQALRGVGAERFAAGGGDIGTPDPGVKRVVLATHDGPATQGASVVLPMGLFPEVDGTVVNFEGRVQRMKAAYPPPFLGRAGVWILGELAQRLGAGEGGRTARDVFAEVAREVPAFRGLTYDCIGGKGTGLAAVTPA